MNGGRFFISEHSTRPAMPGLEAARLAFIRARAAHQEPTEELQTMTATQQLTETPAQLTARARSLISSARVCANVNGHRLGRWTRGQTGRRDSRYYSSECRACHRSAWVLAGDGQNSYGSDAVMFRCAARPENRCQLAGVEPIRTGPDGSPVCELPYITVWHYGDVDSELSAGLRACTDHSRTYRHIAARVPGFGWKQTSGPTDY